VDAPATFLAGADVEAAAERRGTFEHAAQTKAGFDASAVGVAVVGDVDVQLVRAVFLSSRYSGRFLDTKPEGCGGACW
jgi:hypothetical protein